MPVQFSAPHNANYRSWIDSALCSAGIDPASIRSHSLLIPTDSNGTAIHAYAIGPENPERIEITLPGGFFDAVQLKHYAAHLISQGKAVVFHETYGHGPASSKMSSCNPTTRTMHKTTDGFETMMREGLIPLFEQQPQWGEAPLHLLGHSMGGIILADYLTRDNFSRSLTVSVSEKETAPVRSVTFVNPGLAIRDDKHRVGATIFVPLMRGALWASGGRLERRLENIRELRTPIEGEPEPGVFQKLISEKHLYPQIPVPMAATIHTFSRKVAKRIEGGNWNPEIPILWMIYPDDDKIDANAVAERAMEIGGDRAFMTFVGKHTPLKGETALCNFIGALNIFQTAAEKQEKILPDPPFFRVERIPVFFDQERVAVS
jgi:pimeloyl-ACP methyl ester carboxylesterase